MTRRHTLPASPQTWATIGSRYGLRSCPDFLALAPRGTTRMV